MFSNSQAITPNGFLLGAPKSATTSLYDYLGRHSKIYTPQLKEPGWFTSAKVRPEFRRHNPHLQNVEAYLSLYRSAPESALVRLDGSTSYLRDPDALRAIIEMSPLARAVAVVRDPVELVSSYYEFLRYEGWEDAITIEEAWARQDDRARGIAPKIARRPDSLHYANVARLGKQVEQALTVFTPARLCVIAFDDIRSDLDRVSAQLQAFFDLPYENLGILPTLNPTREPRAQWIDRLIKNPPGWLRLSRDAFKRILKTNSLGIRKLLDQTNAKPFLRSLSPEMEEILRHEFSADVDLLCQVTGRDFRALWNWDR